MSTLRRIAKDLSPHLLVKAVSAKRSLNSVSAHPWLEVCSPSKLEAMAQSRFGILPPAFRKDPSFVIDIGANAGQWIGSLLKVVSIPEVWIFEPNPEAMKACQARIGSGAGIKYFNTALGDSCGRATLHVTESSDFASVLQPRDSFLSEHYGGGARIVADKEVELRTLDSLVPDGKRVSLLKIDVQGFERAVLAGAGRVLKNTVAVLIEVNMQSHYLGDDNFPALWTILSDHGFSFWSMSPPMLGRDGQALWADAVFLNSSVPAANR